MIFSYNGYPQYLLKHGTNDGNSKKKKKKKKKKKNVRAVKEAAVIIPTTCW